MFRFSKKLNRNIYGRHFETGEDNYKTKRVKCRINKDLYNDIDTQPLVILRFEPI